MGWQCDEVWLETDVLWFREQPRQPFIVMAMPGFATSVIEPSHSAPVATGLEASRERRLEAQAARKRRFATRTVPVVALVLGSATMLPIWALRQDGTVQGSGALQEDPPSLTFRLYPTTRLGIPEAPFLLQGASSAKSAGHKLARTPEFAKVEWHHATSIGLPYSGRLVDGTQLPVEGRDWVTWNPVTDTVLNLPHRLYGNEHTIRTIITVLGAYRAAHPDAPRVVVGDISFRDGGTMEEHVSHQNGLDVDVYYPRLDHTLRAPLAPDQVDYRLAQDLLDRFVAAGVQTVFVGYSTGLQGPSGVVVPYPNHENHMHVRFPSPPG